MIHARMLRAAVPAMLTLVLPSLASAQSGIIKGDSNPGKPDNVEPAEPREESVELSRALYAVRKLQVIAVRENERGEATLRFDVHFDDDAPVAFDEIADAVESIGLGKGAAGGKTKFFAIEGEERPEGAEQLPAVLELDIPLGHAAVTIFDPDREYTLVVSRYKLGGAEEIGKFDAKVETLSIENRLEEVRCWYLLPGAGVVICYAGPDTFTRTEKIRLEAIEGPHDEDVEVSGMGSLGKAQLHGLPQATGVQAEMRPGAMMTLSLQLVLLGPG